MIAEQLPQLDDVDRRSGGIFDYVSPSRLNLWLRCPLALKLRYIDGIRTPPTASLLVGQCVHWALEQHYRHRQLGITLPSEEIVGRLRESWEAALAEAGAQLPQAASDAAREQAASLAGSYLAAVAPSDPKPLAVECRLEAPLVDPYTGDDLGMPLVGILDLVLPSVDGPVICDFKTSARSAAPLELAHEVQLGCYAYLFRQVTAGTESELQIRSLIKTKVPKAETHRYAARTPGQFRRLFAVIREYLDAIHAGRFNYRPAWTCATCDFHQRCAGHVA